MRIFLANNTARTPFVKKMSFTPPFKYISAPELAELVKKTDTKEVQVIDVRDDDFAGEFLLMICNVHLIPALMENIQVETSRERSTALARALPRK
jgi:hypothetical protein